MTDFQTTAAKVSFLGFQLTVTFGLYLLFGAGYVDSAFVLFFGPFNLEIRKDEGVRAQKSQKD